MRWDGRWTPSDLRRFLEKIHHTKDGCWVWTGGKSRGGGKKGRDKGWYGSFWCNGFTLRAHTFICVVFGIHCPPGMQRDHTCNNTQCVNPKHIEIVTNSENQDRKKARRR